MEQQQLQAAFLPDLVLNNNTITGTMGLIHIAWGCEVGEVVDFTSTLTIALQGLKRSEFLYLHCKKNFPLSRPFWCKLLRTPTMAGEWICHERVDEFYFYNK